jgi:hypothetical protein
MFPRRNKFGGLSRKPQDLWKQFLERVPSNHFSLRYIFRELEAYYRLCKSETTCKSSFEVFLVFFCFNRIWKLSRFSEKKCKSIIRMSSYMPADGKTYIGKLTPAFFNFLLRACPKVGYKFLVSELGRRMLFSASPPAREPTRQAGWHNDTACYVAPQKSRNQTQMNKIDNA